VREECPRCGGALVLDIFIDGQPWKEECENCGTNYIVHRKPRVGYIMVYEDEGDEDTIYVPIFDSMLERCTKHDTGKPEVRENGHYTMGGTVYMLAFPRYKLLEFLEGERSKIPLHDSWYFENRQKITALHHSGIWFARMEESL
jgi:ribosomal protein S27AE